MFVLLVYINRSLKHTNYDLVLPTIVLMGIFKLFVFLTFIHSQACNINMKTRVRIF